jgi:hypothetical protein
MVLNCIRKSAIVVSDDRRGSVRDTVVKIVDDVVTLVSLVIVKRAVIRLPTELVHRLDDLTEELRHAHPDATYSRASLVRALIASGLTLSSTRDDRLLELAQLAARKRGEG